MKFKALHPKKEYQSIREMVEDIGHIYNGRPAYRYRVNPHDKEPVVVNYEQLRDDVRGLASEIIANGLAGKKIALILKDKATLCGGIILILLGIKTVLEHLNIL